MIIVGKLTMRHNLPPTPAFRDSPATDAAQEIALRVIAEFPGWQFYQLGTAVLIGGHLAITAKHVLEDPIRRFGCTQTAKGLEVTGYSIRLLQVLPGPIYRMWNVSRAWITPTDIAVLHIGLDRTSEDKPDVAWRSPVLRLMPPPTGEKVLAFGYRESKIEVSEKPDGGHHIELNDKPTTSIGEVGQIFPERRDSSMLTFPCFEVCARFAPGMSGGMVIDENGALCGLVCAGCNFADPDALPLSYVATLWPMLTTVISIDRGEAYPRGVQYPMIDLALDKLINVVGLEQLDPTFFPGRNLLGRGALNRNMEP
jgi:trypsin-like peptidase